MEIQKYLEILWRRKWVIVSTLTVTMIVVIIGTLMTTPIYSATALLRIAAAATGTVNYADYMYADRLMNTYVTISTSKIVLDQLRLRLGLITLPEIDVKTVPNTELIQITVEDTDPFAAANVANTLADLLISQSIELYSGGGKSSLEILSTQLAEMETEVNQARKEYVELVASNPDDTENIQAAKQTLDLKQRLYADLLDQYERSRLNEAIRSKSIFVAEPAYPSDSPTKPNKALNIFLGFLIGTIGGLGLAFLFENIDSTLYTVEQIQDSTSLPTLGMVPNIKTQKQFVSPNGSNPYGDAFRRLRTNIYALENERPLHTLLITSSEPGEGKSIVVTYLASAMAKSGQKVIVLDCDMRLPSLHKFFNLPNDKGLSNILTQKSDFESNIQETNTSQMHVLTSGPPPRNPAELLGSSQMSTVIEQLSQRYDTVLLDSPPVLEVTDAAVLAMRVDGVILVVSRAQSRKKGVQSAIKQLADVNAKTIGVVINRAERDSSHYYYNPRKVQSKK